jgi:hypothetical protein
MGVWYLERWWGFGNIAGDEGLFEWYPDQSKIAERDRIPLGEKWDVSDPGEMSRFIKKASLFLGASDVGICKVDTNFHRFIRWQVKKFPQLDSFYLRADDLCGYGKQVKLEEVWKQG